VLFHFWCESLRERGVFRGLVGFFRDFIDLYKKRKIKNMKMK